MTTPGYPQAPYPQPHYPTPPPRKKNTALWIVLGVLVGILVLCGGCSTLMAAGGKDSSKPSTTVAAPKPGEPRAANAESEAGAPSPAGPPPAGSEVRDGKFAFVVTQIEPPVTHIGNTYFGTDAQGEFLLVHLDVTNTSDRPQTYFGSNQKLIDDQGREFSNDFEAEVYANDDTITSEINPGNKFSVILVFDVPVGTQPAVFEFHDSAFSGGAEVAAR